jgi:hypothetical protein
MRSRFALVLVAVLSATGCVHDPATAYVEADRLTFETVGEEWRGYFEADSKLDEKEKDRRRRKLRTWKARIDAGRAVDAPEPKPER